MKFFILLMTAGLTLSTNLRAEAPVFQKGPVFENFGENVEIDEGLTDPRSQSFKVVFDVSKENNGSGAHAGFNSIARFINMHVRAGVPLDNIDVALVVHGKATFSLLNEAAYKSRFNESNPSRDLLDKLLEEQVQIYVCGQSAVYHGIGKSDLTAQVEMSLSAMTANALLQQQGYTLNPF